MSNHHIQKQIFKIQTDDEQQALLIQQQITELAKRKLREILEKQLDRYALPNQLIRLDSLELNLGEIPQEELAYELPRRLAKALDQSLQKALAGLQKPGRIPEPGVSVQTIKRSDEELIRYFLLHGRIPWWADHTPDAIFGLVQQKLRAAPKTFVHLLKRIHHEHTVLQRLSFQFPISQIYLIIEELAGRKTGAIASFLREQSASNTSTYTASVRLHRQLLAPSLAFLLDLAKPFDLEAFVKHVKQFMANDMGLLTPEHLTQKKTQTPPTDQLSPIFSTGQTTDSPNAWESLHFFLINGYFPEKWMETGLTPSELLLELLARHRDIRQLFSHSDDPLLLIKRIVAQVPAEVTERLLSNLGGSQGNLLLLLKNDLETQVKRQNLQLPGFTTVLSEKLLETALNQPGERPFAVWRQSLERNLYDHYQSSAPTEIDTLFLGIRPSAEKQPKTRTPIELDIVGHYLRYGSFPLWKKEQAPRRLAREVRRILQKSPGAFIELLRSLSPATVSERLVEQLDDSLTLQIVALLGGQSTRWLSARMEKDDRQKKRELLEKLIGAPPSERRQILENQLHGEATARLSDFDQLALFIEKGVLPVNANLQSVEALEKLLMQMLDRASPALLTLLREAPVERLIHQFSENAIKKWVQTQPPPDNVSIGAFTQLSALIFDRYAGSIGLTNRKGFIWQPILIALRNTAPGEAVTSMELFHEMRQYSKWSVAQLQAYVASVWKELPVEKQKLIDRNSLDTLADTQPEVQTPPAESSLQSLDKFVGRFISEEPVEEMNDLFVQTLEEQPLELISWVGGALEEPKVRSHLIELLQPDTLVALVELMSPDFAGFVQTQNLLLQLLYERHPAVFSRIADPKVFSWASALSYLTGASPGAFQTEEAIESMVRSVADQTDLSPTAIAESLLVIARDQVERGQLRFDAIAHVLQRQVNERTDSKTATEEIKPGKFDSQMLIAYFGGDTKAENWSTIEALLLKEMAARPLIMRNILWNLISREEYRIKLLGLFSEEAFWRFIDLMHPRERAHIYALEKDLRQLLNRKLIRLHLLRYLYDLNQGPFNPADFIQLLFGQASVNPVRYRQLVESSIKFLEVTHLPTKKELLEILRGLQRKVKKESTSRRAIERDFKPEQRLKEAAYIPNAGVVLLSPFFTRYFEVLGMTEKGAFKSPEQAERAVHLLQYLVNGQTETPEHELVLNKVLCSVPVNLPIVVGIELTDTEVEMSNTLLHSAVGNWERMKNLPIANLRGSFLLREGRLEEKQAAWTLTVEPKPYDILLDTLPWGLSMVKLPWMEKILNIDWR